MGWETVGSDRVYVRNHFLGEAPSSRKAALKSEILDEFIDKLTNATPQQIKDYVQANTGDINEVRILLTKLAVAISYALERGAD